MGGAYLVIKLVEALNGTRTSFILVAVQHLIDLDQRHPDRNLLRYGVDLFAFRNGGGKFSVTTVEHMVACLREVLEPLFASDQPRTIVDIFVDGLLKTAKKDDRPAPTEWDYRMDQSPNEYGTWWLIAQVMAGLANLLVNANKSDVIFHNTVGEGEDGLIAWQRVDRAHRHALAADSDVPAHGVSCLAIRRSRTGDRRIEYVAVPDRHFTLCRRILSFGVTLTGKGYRMMQNVAVFNDGVKNNGPEELLLCFLDGSHDWSLKDKFPCGRRMIHEAARELRQASAHPGVTRPQGVADAEVRANLAEQAQVYVRAVLDKCVTLTSALTDKKKRAASPFTASKVAEYMGRVTEKVLLQVIDPLVFAASGPTVEQPPEVAWLQGLNSRVCVAVKLPAEAPLVVTSQKVVFLAPGQANKDWRPAHPEGWYVKENEYETDTDSDSDADADADGTCTALADLECVRVCVRVCVSHQRCPPCIRLVVQMPATMA